MEEEKSKKGDGDFPWLSCVMGCRPPDDKEVTLLKCLHVICRPTCKENWMKQLNSKGGSLPNCPRCQMLVKEEDLKEKVILKNVFPQKLRKDDVKVICDMCIDNLPATTYCPTCSQYLCEICTKTHSRSKSTFNHNIETNLDQRREIEFQRMLEKQNQCKVKGHSGCPITKYCTTCQQKLCALCDHVASHKILDTQKGNELLIADLEAAKELYKKVEQSIEQTRCKKKEFGSRMYVAITSEVENIFALYIQTLRECRELINAEVRNDLQRKETAFSDLEARLECIKEKIAQMCKTYGSVHDNLDDAGMCYFSLLASECPENVNVLAENLKNGHMDMVDNSKEFSLDPQCMKRVQSQLKNGLDKLQSELRNLDETSSMPQTPLDAGYGASTEKDIEPSVSSVNPSTSSPPKTRSISVKSMENGGDACGNDQISKEKTSKGKTGDIIEMDLPSKANEVEGPNEAKENGGKDKSSVTVRSAGISPNETSLSDSSDKTATVRVGRRNRRKTVYQDFVDSTEDIVFSMNEDTDSSQGLDDTWSENDFESGTESVLSAPSSRRQSLRKRGVSSTSKPSTSALGELASDKKKGKGVRSGKMKRTYKRPTNDDFVSDGRSPDKRRKIDSRERNYICQTCFKAFPSKHALEQHERIHTGEKPFQCSVCNKSFNQISNLNTHESIHTGEKPFQCSFCSKSFRQTATLMSHILIHTGEKPYSCRTCGERFRYRQYLKAHKSKLNHYP